MYSACQRLGHLLQQLPTNLASINRGLHVRQQLRYALNFIHNRSLIDAFDESPGILRRQSSRIRILQ